MTQGDSKENWPGLPSNTVPFTGKRKRVRDNHNELERIRRTNQKAHLDALRLCLPYPDMDERASMVSIFIRGREYITALEQRIDELQRALIGTNAPGTLPQQHPVATPSHPMPQVFPQPIFPHQPPSLQPNLEEFDSHLKTPMPVVMHGGIQFYNPNYSSSQSPRKSLSPLAESAALTATNISEQTFKAAPIASLAPRNPQTLAPYPVSLRSRTPSAETIDAQQLFDFVIDSHPEAQQLMLSASSNLRRGSSVIDEALLRDFKRRRASSLLLPLGDQAGAAMLFQKRDSLSTLFSGLLPDIVNENFMGGEIKCSSCSLGMCNQIMIDCDRCRAWFHIRCLGIDANSIPTIWTCSSCTQ
jgi:hypothetical protein